MKSSSSRQIKECTSKCVRHLYFVDLVDSVVPTGSKQRIAIMGDLSSNLSFSENFIESIAQILSKALTDKETGKQALNSFF